MMEIKTLYRYTRPDGGVSTSMTCPECDYVILYRLIASDGMGLSKDNGNIVTCIDVEDYSGWIEVELPEIEEDEEVIEDNEVIDTNNPKFIMLTGVEYLEWLDYKSRVSALEYEMTLIANSVGGIPKT